MVSKEDRSRFIRPYSWVGKQTATAQMNIYYKLRKCWKGRYWLMGDEYEGEAELIHRREFCKKVT